MRLSLIPVVALTAVTAPAGAQIARALTLADARSIALRVNADVAGAAESVVAAAARERQATAFTNPTFTLGREQTSGAGQRNAQDVFAVDQRLEAPSARRARHDAARLRREGAEAQLAAAKSQLDFEVAYAYAQAVAADRRVAYARQAAESFGNAITVSERRFGEGDISGFAVRRIRLEAARYAAALAEATLATRTARIALGALLAASPDSVRPFEGVLGDSLPLRLVLPPTDSLVAIALERRADVRAGALDLAAADADARLAAQERTPPITLSAGSKTEHLLGGGRLSGFVAGVSLPLPIWDRRAGSITAAQSDARRRGIELQAVRRRVIREVTEALDGLRALQAQLEQFSPRLLDDADVAMRAAQGAYVEGEVTLLEWLDTVRAHQEAGTSLANLRAEQLIRAANLERAAGIPILQVSR